MPAHKLPLPAPLEPPGSFLFSNDELESITDEERRFGRFTGARLPEAKERSILQLLKERRPFREIARLLSVAFETVQLVAQRHAVELDKHWKEFPAHLRRTGWYATDLLERKLDSMPVAQLPQTIKALIELAELMDGRATSRVEHVTEARRVDSVEEYERIIGPIEKKIAGTVIEPGQEMHLLEGKKPAPAPDGDLAAAADPDPRVEATCDTESQGSSDVAQANGSPATLSGYTLDPDQAQTGPPGGGSPPAGEGPGSWRHSDS